MMNPHNLRVILKILPFLLCITITYTSYGKAQIIDGSKPPVNLNQEVEQVNRNTKIRFNETNNPLAEAEKIYAIVKIFNENSLDTYDKIKKVFKKANVDLNDSTIISVIQKNRIEEELEYLFDLTRKIKSNKDKNLILSLDNSINKVIPEYFITLDVILENLNLIHKVNYGAAQSGAGVILGVLGGGINQTDLLYGLKDFIVSRAQEQMYDMVINQFLKDADSKAIISIMLPQTLNQLKTKSPDALLTNSKVWKASFETDIMNMPVNLADLLINYLDSLGNNTSFVVFNNDEIENIKSIIVTYKEIFKGVQQRLPAHEILGIIANQYKRKSSNKITTFERGYLMTYLLYSGFIYQDNNNIKFVDPYSFINAKSDVHSIYYTLLYYRHQEDFKRALNLNANTVAILNEKKDFVMNTTEHLSSVFASLYKLISVRETNIDKLISSPDIVDVYMKELLGITEVSLKMVDQFSNSKLDTSTFTLLVKPIGKNLMRANQGVKNKEFGEVISAVINTLTQVGAYLDTKKDQSNPDTSTNGAADKFKTAAKTINQYGTFIVDLMYANDKSQVQSALDNLVPRNQYHIKQRTKSSLSLQTYAGLRSGKEWVITEASDMVMTNINNMDTMVSAYSSGMFIGPSIPIGLEFNWGYKNSFIGSQGIFFHIIELGNLLNYRIIDNKPNNDEIMEEQKGIAETKSNPDINFGQVFSPGIYFLNHFRRTPLSIGIGYTFSPQLRNIQTINGEQRRNVHQFGLFFAMDVTMFQIFASKRTFKNYDNY